MSQHSRPTPGYNTPIPESITTPDRLETRIGTLEFQDGLPRLETARLVYDHLDFLRGVEVFLSFVPMASLEALRTGHEEAGVALPHQAAIADRLLDSNPLLLTGNTDTVYCSLFLDLERDGPTVVEIPPGCGPGTVNDAFFRFVVDMGAPGPDRGQGGRYLIVPSGFEGAIPDGYHVAHSPSHANWVILRGFLVDGKPDAAVEMFRTGLRAYPLRDVDHPPEMVFTSLSGALLNTIHANDATFYDEIDRVIQREPIDMLDPELRGLAASIGIVKGTPFAPDARMREILVDAAAVGSATARTLVFRSRREDARLYEDSAWVTAFVGGSHEWLADGGVGGRDLDARAMFFYFATVNTPAMTLEMVGAGSQYAVAYTDATGASLDGGRAYTLRLPPDPPAKDFWSVVIYDPQTRSELQTGQPFPGTNSQRDTPARNSDGSVTLHFGPHPPGDGNGNWIQTVPGKSWFAVLRLYGPLEPWFDKSWRPGEIEPAEPA